MVLEEVKRLLEEYEEEVSITITGHSLGAAVGTLNAVDIVKNGFNKHKARLESKPCPVTAFFFGSPHVGDAAFCSAFQSEEDLHLLRVRNTPDIISMYSLVGHTDVGEEHLIDNRNRQSPYLKHPGDTNSFHNLEGYLHGVAGTHGASGRLHLEVERDIALVNKRSGMVQTKAG